LKRKNSQICQKHKNKKKKKKNNQGGGGGLDVKKL